MPARSLSPSWQCCLTLTPLAFEEVPHVWSSSCVRRFPWCSSWCAKRTSRRGTAAVVAPGCCPTHWNFGNDTLPRAAPSQLGTGAAKMIVEAVHCASATVELALVLASRCNKWPAESACSARHSPVRTCCLMLSPVDFRDVPTESTLIGVSITPIASK